MIEKQKIGNRQIFFVILANVFAGGMYFHSLEYKIAGRSMIITIFISGAILTLMSVIIWYLSKSFPGYTIFQILGKCSGKIIEQVFSIIYVILAIALAIVMLRVFAGLVNNFILIHTPIWVPMLMILLISIYIISKGLEVQARMVVITAPVIIILYFIGVSLGLINMFDISNLLPLFESDTGHIMRCVYNDLAALIETIFILLIFSAAVRKPDKSLRTIVLAMVLTTTLFTIGSVIFEIGILGLESAQRIAYGVNNVAYIISVGDFIQGLEIFILIILEIIAITKVTVNIYCAWITASHVMGNKSKMIILPVAGLTTYIGALCIDSMNRAFFYYVKLTEYFIVPFLVLVLLLALILVLVKKRRSAIRD